MDPTQQMIITVITSTSVTGAVTGLVRYFIDRHDRKSGRMAKLELDIEEIRKNLESISNVLSDLVEEMKSLKEDDIVLLHDRIYQALTYLSKFKEINLIDRCNVDYIHERYQANGGNHKEELMYELIKKIPVVDDNGNIIVL